MSGDLSIPVPDWLQSMPKVELHVHLEGTMQPATLWMLSQGHGIDLGIRSERDAEALFAFRDFPHFIDVFTACSDCLRTAEDLALIALDYGAELARQNVRYAEVHFNPEPHFRRKGIAFVDQLSALNDARSTVVREYDVTLCWIADGVRDALVGPSSADRTVDWLIEAGHDCGVIGLGLGGNEIGHPPAPFARAFARAREAGFHVVAHAGEALGPESIRDTLRHLQPERIGHGIAAARDQDLMRDLVERRIPLEISPTSNLRTGVVGNAACLPLATLREHGAQFSINSDDPPMFGTDLVSEYALAASVMGLDRIGVAWLARHAIDQSFASDELKARLRHELHEHTPHE